MPEMTQLSWDQQYLLLLEAQQQYPRIEDKLMRKLYEQKLTSRLAAMVREPAEKPQAR